jgi:hypothetical protein
VVVAISSLRRRRHRAHQRYKNDVLAAEKGFQLLTRSDPFETAFFNRFGSYPLCPPNLSRCSRAEAGPRLLPGNLRKIEFLKKFCILRVTSRPISDSTGVKGTKLPL